MNNNQIRNYKPETHALLRALIAAGMTIVRGDNGENTFEFQTENDFIGQLTATDESKFTVRLPNGKTATFFLVFGNSPGELVCDMGAADAATLETVEDIAFKVSDEWAGKPQPMETLTVRHRAII